MFFLLCSRGRYMSWPPQLWSSPRAEVICPVIQGVVFGSTYLECDSCAMVAMGSAHVAMGARGSLPRISQRCPPWSKQKQMSYSGIMYLVECLVEYLSYYSGGLSGLGKVPNSSCVHWLLGFPINRNPGSATRLDHDHGGQDVACST